MHTILIIFYNGVQRRLFRFRSRRTLDSMVRREGFRLLYATWYLVVAAVFYVRSLISYLTKLLHCFLSCFSFALGTGSVDWRGTKCFARSRDRTLRTGLTCMDWERASPTFPIAWISFWTESDPTILTILIWHKVRAHSMDWYTHGISSPPTDWMRSTTR